MYGFRRRYDQVVDRGEMGTYSADHYCSDMVPPDWFEAEVRGMISLKGLKDGESV